MIIQCIIKRVNLLFSARKVCTPGGLSPTVVHVPTEKHKRKLIRSPSDKLLDIETTFWIKFKMYLNAASPQDYFEDLNLHLKNSQNDKNLQRSIICQSIQGNGKCIYE